MSLAIRVIHTYRVRKNTAPMKGSPRSFFPATPFLRSEKRAMRNPSETTRNTTSSAKLACSRVVEKAPGQVETPPPLLLLLLPPRPPLGAILIKLLYEN
jgi:hypothetical protein